MFGVRVIYLESGAFQNYTSKLQNVQINYVNALLT